MDILNFRDLGGITTADGKELKQGRVLRGADLHTITDKTATDLCNIYDLRQVIDFRSPAEVTKRPNIPIANVNQVQLDVFEECAHQRMSLDMPTLSYDTATEHMVELYKRLILAKDFYSKFIRALLDNKNGATYFHCAQGKDRTGFGAALFLKILGVPNDAIYTDYLQSIASRKESNALELEEYKKQGYTGQALEGIATLLTIDKSYLDVAFAEIDKLYGNFDNYINNELGITPEETAELKSLYLQ